MKKSNLILAALFAMSILAVLAFSGCEEPNPDYTVKYEITGPATVASYVTYYSGKSNEVNGGNIELKNVNIPWSKTISVKENSAVGCSVTVDNDSTYTATVYINGKQKNSQSGKHRVAALWGTGH